MSITELANVGPPPVPFLSIFRLALPSPKEQVELSQFGSVRCFVVPTPMEVFTAEPTFAYGDGSAAASMRTVRREFLDGPVLVLRQEVEFGLDKAAISINASEVVAVLDLHFKGLVQEKVFEGAISTPASFTIFPDGPIRLHAGPRNTVDEISAYLRDVPNLGSLNPESRERFRLCSRWYRRGMDSLNQIDRYLSLFIALEVFPATATTDVPGSVQDFLYEHLGRKYDKRFIKETLRLGPITGLRADIVHKGKASVAREEMDEFSKKLDLLEEVTRECLGGLGGFAYSGGLEKWLDPRGNPA